MQVFFYLTQLLDNENEYMTFQSVTDHFPFLSGPDSFNDYVKLYTAIPESWEYYDHSQKTFGPPLRSLSQRKTKCNEQLVFIQKCLFAAYLMEKQIGPIKSQISWCNEINTTNSTIDWKFVYRNNYYSTSEVKLRSFQLS